MKKLFFTVVIILYIIGLSIDIFCEFETVYELPAIFMLVLYIAVKPSKKEQ